MLQSLSSTAELINAVRNSTAEVDLNDAASLTSVTGQYNGQLKVVRQSYNIQPFGILCNEQNQSLCCAFIIVINYLIQQGTYEQLLKTYSYSYIHQEFISVVERVYQNVHQFLAFVKLN
jgi:ABC-type amino acid transport substrate-binding protein